MTLLGTCLALAGGGCDSSSAPANGIRHVVLISLDTTRADHFGFLGDATARTPRLDALAQESIVLTDLMSAAPTTLASHTSLFTGKYPHHHGTPRNGFMVNLDNVMLTEILKEAGFLTAGFLGSFALESRFDFDQGFDHFDEEFDVMVGQDGADQNQRSAADVTDAVIAYLDRTGLPDRLFLFAHYFDPHAPYDAPAPFGGTRDTETAELLPVAEVVRDRSLPAAERARHAQRHALRYAEEISYTDHHVGRLLDDLRERGILDETLVVVTSDHGENLLNHPAPFDHGFTLFQSTMHAVGLLRLPGAERGGTRVDRLASNVDLLPTMLDLLDLEAPAGIDGEVLSLDGAPVAAVGTRFGQATKPWEQVETDPRWTNALKARAIRRGPHKLVQVPYANVEQLFDLSSDPGERNNLLRDPTPETTALAAELRQALEAWAASAAPLPSSFESSQRDETIDRLKSLGYLN